MYRFNNGSLYLFSEKLNAYVHVAVVPLYITTESAAIEWHEDSLIRERDEAFL